MWRVACGVWRVACGVWRMWRVAGSRECARARAARRYAQEFLIRAYKRKQKIALMMQTFAKWHHLVRTGTVGVVVSSACSPSSLFLLLTVYVLWHAAAAKGGDKLQRLPRCRPRLLALVWGW